jgi:hypothetical protein
MITALFRLSSRGCDARLFCVEQDNLSLLCFAQKSSGPGVFDYLDADDPLSQICDYKITIREKDKSYGDRLYFQASDLHAVSFDGHDTIIERRSDERELKINNVNIIPFLEKCKEQYETVVLRRKQNGCCIIV